MIRLTASDLYTLFCPSKCENRVYLKHKGMKAAPPGPYEEVLYRLAERHEESHLATLGTFVDLSQGRLEDRERRTGEEIRKGAPVLYQPVLTSRVDLVGLKVEVLGIPDFLIRQGDGSLVRDSKISRRITERDHPEILRQLEIYGWLFEQITGRPPQALEVQAGTGEIVRLPYDAEVAALNLFQNIAGLKLATSEPYSPVGWSKCGGCSFHAHCWPRAEKTQDVALVFGVDQGLALALRDRGVTTIAELLGRFDERSLAEIKRPWGSGLRKMGKGADSILRSARAMASGREEVLAPPQIPTARNYVMFDLEGLPPHLDELEKVYLWGLQVFGEQPSDFLPAVAGFGEGGDEYGWLAFLRNANSLFKTYGDIPFVHWHHYEKGHLHRYIERYGDPEGIAERVERNRLDLLPVTQKSIALPLPSYSLKVVEKYVGVKRTLDEYGGEWAMAKYIEASELQDPQQRDQVMDQILTYNREDLEATWAVLKWLRSIADSSEGAR